MATNTRPLHLQLLGEIALLCEDVPRVLPRSRKTRALLAYLALEARPIRREALCELLFESAADPRSALRWSLSRLRPLLETPDGQALHTSSHLVALDTALVSVDALVARSLLDKPAPDIDDAGLSTLEQALAAGYPADLDMAASDRYQLWIGGERETLRRVHRQLLDEQSARTSSPDAALAVARMRVALDPLDTEANARLLACSAQVDGHDRARETLQGIRARFRVQGVRDHELVASWRKHAPETVLGLPDKPSVAVLGFTDLGGHEEGAILAEGLAVDLTLSLGRLRGLFVTARASSARVSRTSIDVQQAGQRLGVRYLVHGTTQRLAQRVRITVVLADAVSNIVLWSEHFDRSLGDLFAVQDEVSSSVASAIEPEIERAEVHRALSKAPEDLSAWECYHRAMWHCFHFTGPDTERAHGLLQQALRLDSRFARAHAGLSFTHYSRAFLNAVPVPEAEVRLALEHGLHSVDLDPRDAMGHWTLGRAHFLARDHDQALQSLEHSLRINANFAQGHYALGFIRAHAGLPREALPELALAERLSPLDPLLFAVEGTRAVSLAIQGRYDEAAQWSLRASREPHAHFHIQAIAAACLVLAGQPTEALRFAQRACREHPGYKVSVFERSFPQRIASHRELIVTAMQSAGVPGGQA